MDIDYEQAFKVEAFLVIADYAYSTWKESGAKYSMTYVSWGQYIHKALLNNQYNQVEVYIMVLTQKLRKFFGFSDEEISKLVMEFFIDREFVKSYEIVKLHRKLYGSYISQ